ncbi:MULTISPECIES: addiction module antitoxin [Photorhabdus]|nr:MULTISPECIES: addiction module antitoxin [Photorhabdus]ETS29668.1 growth regulator [Photorhabdus khanii NC19]
MLTHVRKIANSVGTIIPAQLLKSLYLKEGDQLSIVEEQRKTVISAVNHRPKYKLADRLALCDSEAPMPEILKEWDASKPVGNEV